MTNLTSIMERFDKEFSRTNQRTGEKEPKWFFPDDVRPVDVKSFISKEFTALVEEWKKEVKIMKDSSLLVFIGQSDDFKSGIKTGRDSALDTVLSLLNQYKQ